VVGSPGFMSPEQAEGRPVGPASDVFSLGAVLTFAATGEGPFGEGSTVALLYRVVTSEPNTQGVPAEIRPLIERCLAKDPGQRPTAAGLLAQLSTADVVADPARESTTRKSALPDAARRAPGEFAGPPYPATGGPGVPYPATGGPGVPYPATERAQTPPPSPSAARDQGSTLTPSEFQRAYDRHPTGGERQWPGAAAEPDPRPGGLVAPPGPFRPSGPPPRRTSRRGVLIGVAAVVVLIAVGAVAFLVGKGKPATTTNAGNVVGASSSVTSPAASPSVSSSSSAPPSSAPAQPPGAAAMATLASYLSQSANVRPNVSNAVNGIQACTETPAQAEASVEQAITARQNILNGLQTLSVGALPNGAQLVSALKTAMQNSLNADNDYHAWMADVASSGSSCATNASQNPNYADALTADGAATTSKEAFVNLWNPMAPTYGQPTYSDNGF
jgi:serine/threonine protein kinase